MRGSILVGDNPKVLVETRTCSENAVGFRSTMITFHGMRSIRHLCLIGLSAGTRTAVSAGFEFQTF